MVTPIEKKIEAVLTPAELRVYKAIITTGEGIHAIAKRLGIARNTVRNHVASILQKTRCESRVNLMCRVYKERERALLRQLRSR